MTWHNMYRFIKSKDLRTKTVCTDWFTKKFSNPTKTKQFTTHNWIIHKIYKIEAQDQYEHDFTDWIKPKQHLKQNQDSKQQDNQEYM